MALLNISESLAPTVEPTITRKRKRSMSEAAVEPKRIENKKAPSKVMDEDKPSEKMKKRAAERDDSKTLGEALAEATALMPAGTGPVGMGVKGALGGAAAGATLGEYLAKAMEKKRQKGKKVKEAKAVSEKSYD